MVSEDWANEIEVRTKNDNVNNTVFFMMNRFDTKRYKK